MSFLTAELFFGQLLSKSATTENTAQMLGLATRLSKARPDTPVQVHVPAAEDSAMWVKRTVRSGVRLEYEGNVVVLGDVNPGAEVVAGGSVVVWGRLRGVVHAGAARRYRGSRMCTWICLLLNCG